jgi:hypothetical protein
MTITASGEITLANIAAEFGGSGELQLSDYYGIHPSVPGSGEIMLSDFYGLSADPIITEGTFDQPQDNFGYTDGTHGGSPEYPAFGSIVLGVVSGVVIEAAFWNALSVFYLVLQGNRAKSFFTSVTPEGISLKTSASATHFYDSGSDSTWWTWTASQGGWDGSGTRTLIFT